MGFIVWANFIGDLSRRLGATPKGGEKSGKCPTQNPTNNSGLGSTLPETNIVPENQQLEDEFPFETVYFQWLC